MARSRFFPESYQQAAEWLSRREAETGYRTLELVPGTSLRPSYAAPGAIDVTDDYDNSHTVIVRFGPDGRYTLRPGVSHDAARIARIDCCLPDGWRCLSLATKDRRSANYARLTGPGVDRCFCWSVSFNPALHQGPTHDAYNRP
jgi:hypothetical protein